MSRNIKKIFVHCTDSDDSLDIGFKEINDWHQLRGGLSKSGVSCGYHYHFKTCPNLNMLKLRGNLLFVQPHDITDEIKEIMKLD